jgi:hypothetical protein
MRRQPAQALVWFTLALPLFLSVGGLAIDGALALTARRELQSVADGAARAGATRLDHALLRASGGRQVQIDIPHAYGATHAYLDERLPRERQLSFEVKREVDVRPAWVRVALETSMPTAFLRIVHIDSVSIGASGLANAESGIRAAGDR